MNRIKRLLLKSKALVKIIAFLKLILGQIKAYFKASKSINLAVDYKKRIFYLGAPVYRNLGDLAQGMCIRNWIKKHYPDYYLVEIQTESLINKYFSVLGKLKKIYTDTDFIVFQSGYTTTDLGGFSNLMHSLVIETMPKAKMLMMPQTIFFKSKENAEKCSKTYNRAEKMLFLARDSVSFEMAKKMFPDVRVMLYPDVVTTLIGTRQYNYDRNGILFCCRNDGEKFYSDAEINSLINRCIEITDIKRVDTTKNGSEKEIVDNYRDYIDKEIDEYSRYKVIITDRYHGTIFSLIAGTPVIVIKTNDHKVITGADWFKGVYDTHVFLAEDLEDAFVIAKRLLNEEQNYTLPEYFETAYYDKLAGILKEI